MPALLVSMGVQVVKLVVAWMYRPPMPARRTRNWPLADWAGLRSRGTLKLSCPFQRATSNEPLFLAIRGGIKAHIRVKLGEPRDIAAEINIDPLNGAGVVADRVRPRDGEERSPS